MSRICRLLAQLTLAVPVLLSPWWLGGVKTPVQVAIYWMISVSFASWIAAWLMERRRVCAPLATLPLLLGVILGVVQFLPLPRSVAVWVAPHTVELRERLLTDAAERTESGASVESPRHTFSLSVANTRYQLSLLLLGLASFWLGSQLFATRRAGLWASTIVALNGGLLAVLGILQAMTWNGRLFWIGREMNVGAPFATYINRNNAAGYLNLCFAASLVALVGWIRHFDRQEGNTPAEEWQPLIRSKTSRSMRDELREFVARLEPPVVGMLGLSALILAGICCSLSRGGIVAALIALLVALPAASIVRREWHSLAIAGAIAVGVALVGWVGMMDVVSQRVGSLANRERVLTDGRLSNWSDAVRSVPDFWLTGAGLGTYQDVYRMYQNRFDELWYYYAENQYLQGLIEGGVPALLLLLAMIGLLVRDSWNLVRRGTGIDMAFGVGGLACVAGQAVAGTFDFGLYQPANLLLMGALCGAVAGRATSVRHEVSTRNSSSIPQRILVIATVGMLSMGLPFGLLQIRTLAATERVLDNTEFDVGPAGTSTTQMQSAVDQLEARTAVSRDHAELHYRLAKAYIYLYRNRSLEELRRTQAASSLRALWNSTATSELHGQVNRWWRDGETARVDQLRQSKLVQETLMPAWRQLVLARHSCPILPEIHLRLAQLSWVVAPFPGSDEIYLKHLRALAPANVPLLVDTGQLDLQAGRIDAAFDGWRHAAELSSAASNEIIGLAKGILPADQLVQQVLPKAPGLLIDLAVNARTDADLRTELLQQAETLALGSELPEDERHYLLSRIYQARGDRPAALEQLGEAVRLRSRETSWRYAYGLMLFEAERLEEANQEINRCLSRDPGNPTYRQLLARIHSRMLRKP